MFDIFRASPKLPVDERIDGQSIFIRPPHDDDWQEWATLRERSKDFLVPWEPKWTRDSHSRSTYRRRLGYYAEEWESGYGYAFFIFSRDNERLCGGITLSGVRRGIAQTGTLGYWVGEPFARQGVMTDALGCIKEFFFEHLYMHRLEAACLPRNEASCRVLEKAGFRKEGLAPKYLKINGVWEDHSLYAILVEEAAAQKAQKVQKSLK